MRAWASEYVYVTCARSAEGPAFASMGANVTFARSVEGPAFASMGEYAAVARSAKRGSAKPTSSTTARKRMTRPRRQGPPSVLSTVPEEGGRQGGESTQTTHRLPPW